MKRLEDLARALEEARAALVEARAIESAGTRETVGALADAEQVGVCLSAELAEAARVELAIETQIEERERSLKVLRSALAVEVSKREVLAATAKVNGDRIVALRGKIETERAKVAPMVSRRSHEVERLERRIAVVQAHQAARQSPRPQPVRTVLGFPQASEGSP